jgi:hypothetical protein
MVHFRYDGSGNDQTRLFVPDDLQGTPVPGVAPVVIRIEDAAVEEDGQSAILSEPKLLEPLVEF